MDLWFREPLFCSGCRNNDFSCQTVGETTVGRFAVIVQIPKSYRLTTSPARFSRAVRYAPLRNAIPLCCWNDFEILIDDELVELCHLQLLVEGYIFSLDAFAEGFFYNALASHTSIQWIKLFSFWLPSHHDSKLKSLTNSFRSAGFPPYSAKYFSAALVTIGK